MFAAYGRLYALGNEVELKAEGAPEELAGFYTLAGAGDEGRAVYLVNFSEENRRITTNLDESFEVYLIDKDHSIELALYSASDFTLAPNQIAYIESK